MSLSHAIPCSHCGKTVERPPLRVGGKEIALPWALCDGCAAAREAEALRERRTQERLRRLQHWNKLCPDDYREYDHARLPGAPVVRVLSWRENRRGRGLLLVGPPRSGKTRCAWLLIRRLLLEEAVPVLAVADTEFAHECDPRSAPPTGRPWMQRLCAARILFLDDLGKAAPTERYRQELFHLIEQRAAWRRPVLVTTNLDGQGMAERIGGTVGAGIAERLREFCEAISFDHPNLFQPTPTKETA